MATQAQITAVQQLYVSYLGRAADKAGLDFWSNAIATGTATIASVATGLTLATEYTSKYAGLTTDALVDAVYTNVLGRTADAAGKAFWVASFANGSVKADTFVSSLIQSLGTQDQATINNKTFVAQTYTDTAGAAYNVQAGTQVIAKVDSTPASVNDALASIAGGTLPGQVPALGLINASADAAAAVVTFETDNKAALDALATTLKSGINADFGTELNAATLAADTARNISVTTSDKTVTASGTDTTVLQAQGKVYDAAESKALGALSSSQKTLATSFQGAVATEATAKAAQATDAQETGAVNGLGADATAASALTTLATTFGSAAATGAEKAQAVYDAYESGTYTGYTGTAADLRASIDTALKSSDYYATFKAVVAKDATYADAQKATTAAAKALTDTDVTNGNTKGADYLKALSDKTLYNDFLTKVVAADGNVTAVKAIADAYEAKTDAADAASQAVTDFKADNVKVAALAGTDTSGTGAAVKDVFYFADKLTATSNTPDFKIGSFAAGDSIVLGNSYTYNSGALSTGDNNKTEFFLVKSDAGVQIVLEGANYGSSEVKPDATTGIITSTNTDHAQVITLTGVTIDHVSVANGVVSYV